ncbi:MAG: hypothetical protein BWY06_03473 [Candidatus Latescibacteria bacterium ADurb.Bin168]|nr:MAG: hypothetical protein BWY06_03473 [Candidatus Latescibacteria bacterium ADurb.Bin168]
MRRGFDTWLPSPSSGMNIAGPERVGNEGPFRLDAPVLIPSLVYRRMVRGKRVR